MRRVAPWRGALLSPRIFVRARALWLVRAHTSLLLTIPSRPRTYLLITSAACMCLPLPTTPPAHPTLPQCLAFPAILPAFRAARCAVFCAHAAAPPRSITSCSVAPARGAWHALNCRGLCSVCLRAAVNCASAAVTTAAATQHSLLAYNHAHVCRAFHSTTLFLFAIGARSRSAG